MSKEYDVEGAEALAREALSMAISDAVPIYERLVSSFPSAAKYWKQYAEAHICMNNDDQTKQIFNRCLLNCWHTPLWLCYIRFIRKLNDNKGLHPQEETLKAFEFTLSYLAPDIASGPLWIQYIAFLKSLPSLDDSQRIAALRKTYQRAIVIPSHHLEQLWRDYETFENSVSRALVLHNKLYNSILTLEDSYFCSNYFIYSREMQFIQHTINIPHLINCVITYLIPHSNHQNCSGKGIDIRIST
ncbi:hypothetical protein Leryth_017045 [Lithospermum erythrorhizon]|nr:hypothetical protein Leryth_017045 [Lithospermum erythrorhizon]